MAGTVFVSHAQEDEQRCAALVQILADWGVEFWYERHQQGAQNASGSLSEAARQALAECSVFLRIRTRHTRWSHGMRIEEGAFLGLQADDRRVGKASQRTLVNLILDPAYVREPFDRTTRLLDASDRMQPGWVNSLRTLLDLPPFAGLAAIQAVAETVSPAPARIHRRRAIGVAGAVAAAVAGAGGAVWLLRGGARPFATATPTATPLPHDPRLLWSYDTVDTVDASSTTRVGISGSPAGADTIYVGTDDGSVHALHRGTGKLLWKHRTSGGHTVRGVAVGYYAHGDTYEVFVFGGAKGVGLYALAPASGAQQWALDVDLLEQSAVVAGPHLYVTNAGTAGTAGAAGASRSFILVVDVMTGKQKYTLGEGALATTVTQSIPVLVYDVLLGVVLYVGDVQGSVYAFDATQGGKPPLWRADVGAALAKTGVTVASSVAVADGAVYVTSGDGALYALDARTGARRWRQPVQAASMSTPAVSDGLVFVGAMDHTVYALDAATGVVRWRCPTGGAVRSSPEVAIGVVYVGADDRRVYAIDAQRGTLLATYQTGGMIVSKPLYLSGALYVTALDGLVYAYGGYR